MSASPKLEDMPTRELCRAIEATEMSVGIDSQSARMLRRELDRREKIIKTHRLLFDGIDVDKALGWSLGKADRLAKRGKLPHIKLPDGSIRFDWREIEPLLVRVPAK